jgi:hypothetical protein
VAPCAPGARKHADRCHLLRFGGEAHGGLARVRAAIDLIVIDARAGARHKRRF